MGGDCRDRALRDLDKLPPFSRSLNALLAELAEDRATAPRLAKLIEDDPVLTSHILRRANSGIHAYQTQIRSVGHAVVLLGMEEVRQVALSLSTARLWGKLQLPAGSSKIGFNRHSSGTALLATQLTTRIPVKHADLAGTAGLLHDIAKLLVAVALPEQFSTICGGASWDHDREVDVLGVTHAELSGAVIERWKLPQELRGAVTEHHAAPRGATPTLAHLLGAADDYTAVLGSSIEAHGTEFCSAALTGLGIDEQVPELVAEFHLAFERAAES